MRRNSPIGGQAVLEGVMMRSPTRHSIAVRRADGQIISESSAYARPPRWRRLPFLRGVFNMAATLKLGMQCINRSAELYGLDAEQPSRFERWLADKTGLNATSLASTLGVVLGVGLSVGLFIVLPSVLVGLLRGALGNPFLLNLAEGVLRLAIFLGYLLAVTALPDIRRFFGYHGAEHKVINAYERDLPLTVHNCAAQTTRHPRCGTSFLLVVMVISILVFALTGFTGAWYARVLVRLALLPVVASLSYEVLMALARFDNAFVRALQAPGMLLQAMTTRVPDDAMLEVAIRAFTLCMEPGDAPGAHTATDPAADTPCAQRQSAAADTAEA